MITTALIPSEFYLIDCSSIIAFSGADYFNPNRFLKYREHIWLHLEEMITLDRLKTVSQFWPELEFNDQESYKRLHCLHDKFTLSADDQTDFSVLNLISKYPKLVDYRLHYTREPADPYLIVYARKYGVPIITDEKPLVQRVSQRRNRWVKIPDVCNAEKMKWRCLEDFLKDEGVIP
jgi:hypothetical protein